MDIFSELEIGDKLSIEIRQNGVLQSVNNMLSSQLIDKDHNYLYITPPAYKGQKYSLNKNQNITIFFYRKKGVYEFEAQLADTIEENIIVFKLKPLGNMKKIQRRNYFRLPLVAPAVLKKQENDSISEIKCTIKDLSGGGTRVICNHELKRLEKITIDLYIDEEQVITIGGEVIRVIRDSESNAYELGIRFNQADETSIDRIFSIIFEKQRLMRKKGLI